MNNYNSVKNDRKSGNFHNYGSYNSFIQSYYKEGNQEGNKNPIINMKNKFINNSEIFRNNTFSGISSNINYKNNYGNYSLDDLSIKNQRILNDSIYNNINYGMNSYNDGSSNVYNNNNNLNNITSNINGNNLNNNRNSINSEVSQYASPLPYNNNNNNNDNNNNNNSNAKKYNIGTSDPWIDEELLKKKKSINGIYDAHIINNPEVSINNSTPINAFYSQIDMLSKNSRQIFNMLDSSHNIMYQLLNECNNPNMKNASYEALVNAKVLYIYINIYILIRDI